MKFTIAYQRALTGNDIDVQVEAEGEEMIFGVTCSLDGFEIGSDDLSEAPVVSFHRTFSRVGDAAPGKDHKILVEATGKDGKLSRATRVWTDPT